MKTRKRKTNTKQTEKLYKINKNKFKNARTHTKHTIKLMCLCVNYYFAISIVSE